MKGAREDEMRSQFENAWEADRALRLFFLISLDPEEENELRSEAADCLESLLAKQTTRSFIENEFYARVLPTDVDFNFVAIPQRWNAISQLVSGIIANQTSIHERREEWDELSPELFEDQNKKGFEEAAIRLGAFRLLASIDAASGDRNLAILDTYQALGQLPNSRTVVNAWTANFKRPGLRFKVEREKDEDIAQTKELKAIDAHAAYEHFRAQRSAIVEKLKSGSSSLARRYCDQLVRFQLKNGGAQYAARSLCDLAQEARVVSAGGRYQPVRSVVTWPRIRRAHTFLKA